MFCFSIFTFDTILNITIHTIINFAIISGKCLEYINTMEHRYRALRNHLDKMGYQYPVGVESLTLVEKLVSDLLHTTERLRHYKEVALQSSEV
jgi:hypothetical protein